MGTGIHLPGVRRQHIVIICRGQDWEGRLGGGSAGHCTMAKLGCSGPFRSLGSV